MNKIYYSKIQDPEKWCDDMGSYYFPFAEKLMRSPLGKWIVLRYVAFSIWVKR